MDETPRSDFDTSRLELLRCQRRLGKDLRIWNAHLRKHRPKDASRDHTSDASKRHSSPMRRLRAITRRVDSLNLRELTLSKHTPPCTVVPPITLNEYIDEARDLGGPYVKYSTETAATFAHRAFDRVERLITRDEKEMTAWEDRATDRIIGLYWAAFEARRELLGQGRGRSVAASPWRERTVNGLKYWMAWVGIKMARQSSPLEYFLRERRRDKRNSAFPRLSADRKDVNDVDHWRRRLTRLSSKRPARPTAGQRRITAYLKHSGRLTGKKLTRMGTLSCGFDWDGGGVGDLDLEATMEWELEAAEKPAVRRRSTVQLKITDFYRYADGATMEEGL